MQEIEKLVKTLRELRIGRYPPPIVVESGTPVVEVLREMADKWVRHAIVVEPGTKKLSGMVSIRGVLEFLGGGERHKIVEEKYGGDLYKALFEEPVDSIQYPPPYVTLDDTLIDVVELMVERDIGALAVTDREGNVVGKISERHIMSLFAATKMFVRVAELMSSPLITMHPQDPLIECQRLMKAKRIRRIVLKDSRGIRGIVSVKDIAKYYSSPEVLERLRLHGEEDVHGTPLCYVAVREVATVSPEVDLGDAIKMMRERNIGSLVVVDEEGRDLGIITERDFIRKLPRIWGVDLFVDEAQKLIIAGRTAFL